MRARRPRHLGLCSGFGALDLGPTLNPLDDLTGLLAANEGFVFDPAKVVVPALILVGNGEYKSEEVQRQTKLCLAGLANPRKQLVVTPAEEGASSHCILDNRSLMSQELFDWLDETFK